MFNECINKITDNIAYQWKNAEAAVEAKYAQNSL